MNIMTLSIESLHLQELTFITLAEEELDTMTMEVSQAVSWQRQGRPSTVATDLISNEFPSTPASYDKNIALTYLYTILFFRHNKKFHRMCDSLKVRGK